MQTISEITFEELEGFHGDIGLITLTRQQALNALNHTMFIALKEQLKMWGQQKNIKAVIIRAAEGRAFCAGGDIRHAYQLKLANDPTLPDFFRDEYEMKS
jgi:enoyl-CoA hydratase